LYFYYVVFLIRCSVAISRISPYWVLFRIKFCCFDLISHRRITLNDVTLVRDRVAPLRWS